MNQGKPCPSCGYENDLTRIFCHQCGLRLPQTDEEIQKKAEANHMLTEQAKTILRHGGSKEEKKKSFREIFASAVHAVVTTAIYAALVAATILAIRAPDDLPAPGKADGAFLEAAERQLQRAGQPGYSGKIFATGEQINDYLAGQQLVQVRSVFSVLNVSVRRVFVQPGAAEFALGLEYSLSGLPLYILTRFTIEGAPENFSLRILGGTIGRLPVHPWLFENYVRWYLPVAEALHQKLQVLSEAQRIAITPGGVEAVWKKKPPAPTPETSPPDSDQPSAPAQRPTLSPTGIQVTPTQLR